MNYIFISPNFPERYYKITEALKRRGVKILVISDAPYESFCARLINSINHYYYADLNDYQAVCQGVEFYKTNYGPIDYIESHNEHWLQLEAALRSEFQIGTGFQGEENDKVKSKILMKHYFKQAGIKTPRYIIPSNKLMILNFVNEVGYPVFVKPIIGVGASDSFAIKDEIEVDSFLEHHLKPLDEYLMEEYIDGQIVSFDGVADVDSRVVLAVQDVFLVSNADLVLKQLDDAYYANPFMDETFHNIGRLAVKSFGIKNRFFHIEFFVLNQDHPGLGKKGEYVAIEVNMRLPGGNTPDLMNYAASVSFYEIYADLLVYGENREVLDHPKFYAASACRRDLHHYVHNLEAINTQYPLLMHGRYHKTVSDDLGDEFFFYKDVSLSKVLEFIDFTLKQQDK
ncbi:MAG: ATP-grasp domain-containing protein [Erysipelotrichaceae bacterium]|jgi:hypothetical protein|nr:ATP-grasp domain-containing protein [Erysipelotrichaceae bacterium]